MSVCLKIIICSVWLKNNLKCVLLKQSAKINGKKQDIQLLSFSIYSTSELLFNSTVVC